LVKLTFLKNFACVYATNYFEIILLISINIIELLTLLPMHPSTSVKFLIHQDLSCEVKLLLSWDMINCLTDLNII